MFYIAVRSKVWRLVLHIHYNKVLDELLAILQIMLLGFSLPLK